MHSSPALVAKQLCWRPALEGAKGLAPASPPLPYDPQEGSENLTSPPFGGAPTPPAFGIRVAERPPRAFDARRQSIAIAKTFDAAAAGIGLLGDDDLAGLRLPAHPAHDASPSLPLAACEALGLLGPSDPRPNPINPGDLATKAAARPAAPAMRESMALFLQLEGAVAGANGFAPEEVLHINDPGTPQPAARRAGAEPDPAPQPAMSPLAHATPSSRRSGARGAPAPAVTDSMQLFLQLEGAVAGANGFSPEEVLHYNRSSAAGPLHPVHAPTGAAAPRGPAGLGLGLNPLAARSVRASSLTAIRECADEAPGRASVLAPSAPQAAGAVPTSGSLGGGKAAVGSARQPAPAAPAQQPGASQAGDLGARDPRAGGSVEAQAEARAEPQQQPASRLRRPAASHNFFRPGALAARGDQDLPLARAGRGGAAAVANRPSGQPAGVGGRGASVARSAAEARRAAARDAAARATRAGGGGGAPAAAEAPARGQLGTSGARAGAARPAAAWPRAGSDASARVPAERAGQQPAAPSLGPLAAGVKAYGSPDVFSSLLERAFESGDSNAFCGLGGGIRNSPLGGGDKAQAAAQRTTAKDRHWEAWEGK
ncbi:hypothetical protein WJX81_005570 [Elliptochloris bilobata]|uniref:Uncharacterized protein n=1 Tax=Elliptochloris bilobata TaxID=381761 RepID=A0AAW1SDL4_9CHLO